MKKFYQEKPLSAILIVAFLLRLISVIFSKGYGMHDDHYLVIEIVQNWIDGFDEWDYLPNSLRPENKAGGHILIYLGFHYYFFQFLELIGINDPNIKMFIIRFLHALFSLLIVKFAYKITEKVSNIENAKMVGWLLALLWFMPMLSVRNLVEIVCIPPLLYGTWLVVSNDKKNVLQFLFAGFITTIAFSLRYQTSTFIAALGLVIWIQYQFKNAFFYGIGVLLSIFIFQVCIDLAIWGKPFAEFLAYTDYNVTNAYNYVNGPWYNFILVVGGILIPPVSLFLLYGFVLSWRKHLILFLPAMVFFVFHSIFPNKQERFILPVVPFIIMAGVITWNNIKDKSDFIINNKKFISGSWKFFWVINTIVLIALTPSSSKLSRVETMNYLAKQKDFQTFVFESSNSGGVLLPRFYLHNWTPYYRITKEENAAFIKKSISVRNLKLPNYLVLGEADNLVKRLAPCIKTFGKVTYVATIEQSYLDKFMHWLNPFGNENQTYYIYKFESPKQ
jgi:hypothetical protein